jgi:hypothetical protein
MLVDITSPKVLPPAFLFSLFSMGFLSNQTRVIKMLLMTVILTIVYKFVLRVTYTPADLIVPALLYAVLAPGAYFTIPSGESITSYTSSVVHTLIFAIIFASLRTYFPQFY